MRASELYEKIPATISYPYRGHKLVHTIMPEKTGAYAGRIWGANNDNLGDYTSTDLEELKKEMENAVNRLEVDDKRDNMDQRDSVSLDSVSSVTLDLNTAFTRQILDNEIPTALRFINENGRPYMDVATREAFELFGDDLKQSDFRMMRDRGWNKKENATKIYGAYPGRPNDILQLGLEFHGVYELKTSKSMDPEMFTRYELDQIGWSDKDVTYPVPTVTIAYTPGK